MFSPPAKVTAETPAVGDRVSVGGKKEGIARFIGTTKFAPGTWVGIELATPGKCQLMCCWRGLFSVPQQALTASLFSTSSLNTICI